MLVAIGKVAQMFGVTPQTIRNWVKQGIFHVQRTAGGHRRFSLEEVHKVMGIEECEKVTVTYTRVSSHDQKDDLVRQTEELKKYCEEQRFANVQAIEDLGSGINYKKKGLQKLIRDVMMGKVNRIVLTYKDRLVRFGIEILEQVCRLKNVELVVLHNDAGEDLEARLVEDVLAILIVYSGELYGRRSHQKRELANVA